MSGLLGIVRSAVAVADQVTRPLQAAVSYQRYTGQDAFGDPNFAAAVSLLAIVDWRARQRRTSTGVLTVSRAMVTFLDAPALAAATAGNGIDDKDVIVLPDLTAGPILDLGGFVDAGTGLPIATEVYLG
jgi:hypothetical protein